MTLAEVFAQLAAAEREHVDSVTRWSQSRRGKAPDPALVRWEAPETFDAETAREIGTSRLTTPYRALAMAVRNEERAFAFWSYVAAYSKDSEIKQAAEAMAREELGHVSTLRKERRRAYHKEHEEAGRSGRGDTGMMQIDARALELRLAAQLADLERGLDGTAATRTRELLEETMQMSGQDRGRRQIPCSRSSSATPRRFRRRSQTPIWRPPKTPTIRPRWSCCKDWRNELSRGWPGSAR